MFSGQNRNIFSLERLIIFKKIKQVKWDIVHYVFYNSESDEIISSQKDHF